ncbi:hypothetical protein [Actibacterium lipolyticum]|uniref:5-aminolevulic acid synthase n=1 Tax=Actibacterium lipolyticum TaxID=1524263 RepID=A0A238KL47_9RHOB|nr:hypothetical protein [Actibacterium lipolyticum]SMX42802.1 hypothetical protein COL8621_02078 [Actibacterium lipolyticum]
MRAFILSSIIALSGAAAMAEPLSGKAARKLMFPTKGGVVKVIAHDFLSKNDRDLLAQVSAQQPYYGAVALSPDEGLMSEATLAAANYHDVESASRAALAGCNAARQKGSKTCVIAAEIRPKGWKPREIQLSRDATAGLRDEYKGGKGAKALAISPATGKWAYVNMDGPAAQAAVAECNEEANTDDCRVVVAD